MKTKLAILLVLAITISMAGNAYAHKSEVVGDYKIEVGWKNEPPVAGIDNAVEVVVSQATDFEKSQSASEEHHHSHNDESMNMEHGDSHNDESSTHDEMNGDKTAEQLHHQAEDLETEGKYAEAAELHHEAGNHHHMAAEDLEKAGDFAGAAEHHEMAAEHHEMAAKDLEKAGKNDEAKEHYDESSEHKKLAKLDREKSANTATDHDHETMSMGNDDHESGEKISGLSDSLNVWVTIGEHKTKVSLVKSTEFPGVYYGEYLPFGTGHTVMDIHGMIENTEVDVQMHPEKVEPLNTLPPLKQMKNGINPGDVMCKDGLDLFMRIGDNSAVCISSKFSERLMSSGMIDYF